MSSTEIKNCYNSVFQSLSGQASQNDGFAKYLTKMPMIRLVPEKVTISQYITLLFMSPTYLLKFWNSVILVVPIVIFQLAVALVASYGFARYRGRIREIIFFAYIILMLMPYQVTLVPNFLVADKFGLIDTRWSIILPAVFSPFSIFLLTKVMKRIPVAYVEAAKLDGAGEIKILTNTITLLKKIRSSKKF